jgi:hypothetical protein
MVSFYFFPLSSKKKKKTVRKGYRQRKEGERGYGVLGVKKTILPSIVFYLC